MCLAMVMCMPSRASFDFVGELVETNQAGVKLKNALAINYDDANALSLRPMYVPYGVPTSYVTIPLENISYFVELPDTQDDWVHKEYNNFFKKTLSLP